MNYTRLTPGQVAAAQPLDYTIRFQNMGTDTAFTVVITDTLRRTRLNLAGLRLVAQSHSCTWRLSGAGLLTVRSPNIKLPHQSKDELGSQGFVRFRVQPRRQLVPGDLILNDARIIFDFNEAIRTNLATTTLAALPTALLAPHPAAAWCAYPNPAHDQLTIAADLPTAGPVQLDLLDGLGRTALRQTLLPPPRRAVALPARAQWYSARLLRMAAAPAGWAGSEPAGGA